jgi:hypothetical protein
MTLTSVGVEREGAFNRWYDRVHVPPIASDPGVLGASRYACVDGGPRFLALYSLAAAEISSSPHLQRVGGWGEMEPHLSELVSRRYRLAAEPIGPAPADGVELVRLTFLDAKTEPLARALADWCDDGGLEVVRRRQGAARAARYECLNGEPHCLLLAELTEERPSQGHPLGERMSTLKTYWSRTYRKIFDAEDTER